MCVVSGTWGRLSGCPPGFFEGLPAAGPMEADPESTYKNGFVRRTILKKWAAQCLLADIIDLSHPALAAKCSSAIDVHPRRKKPARRRLNGAAHLSFRLFCLCFYTRPVFLYVDAGCALGPGVVCWLLLNVRMSDVRMSDDDVSVCVSGC